MADVDFDDLGQLPYEPAPPRLKARSQRFVNIAGAASSVALVIGIAVWGYQIAVRDVRGVPVLRALEGPLRVAPENPGGEIALHQGLAVNNVAEMGIASPPPERLVLAPRAEELSPEDGAGLTTSVAAAPGAGAVPQAERVVTPPPAPLIAAPSPVVEDMETSVAETTAGDPLAEEGVLPVPDPVVLQTAPPPADEGTSLEASDPLLADPPAKDLPVAVARSLVPRARPGGASAAAQAVPVAAAVAPVDPASLKVGEQLVQLGAFDDEALALAEWDKLATRFGDLMTGKAMVVQSAQSGGRTFFRLRAQGFANADDARRFCSALAAEEAGCIPVANR